MFNKSQIMKEAHKRTRQEMRDFPKLYAGYSYAEVFALCLGGVWRDAKAGKFTEPGFERRAKIQNQILCSQMKTHMSLIDYKRIAALRQQLSGIGCNGVI